MEAACQGGSVTEQNSSSLWPGGQKKKEKAKTSQSSVMRSCLLKISPPLKSTTWGPSLRHLGIRAHLTSQTQRHCLCVYKRTEMKKEQTSFSCMCREAGPYQGTSVQPLPENQLPDVSRGPWWILPWALKPLFSALAGPFLPEHRHKPVAGSPLAGGVGAWHLGEWIKHSRLLNPFHFLLNQLGPVDISVGCDSYFYM